MKRDCGYCTTHTLKLAVKPVEKGILIKVYCSYTTQPCGENMLSQLNTCANQHMLFSQYSFGLFEFSGY